MIDEGMEHLRDLILCVGYPGEKHSIKEFVTPEQVMITDLVKELGNNVSNCWDWVCQDIKYPPIKRGVMFDYHAVNAFGVKRVMSDGEYFQLPYQTVLIGIGDCADKSNVLVSMLRNWLPYSCVYTSYGTFFGEDGELDHAWVTILMNGNWYIMETTLPEASQPKLMLDMPEYKPLVHANDEKIMAKTDLECLFCETNVNARILSNIWGVWR